MSLQCYDARQFWISLDDTDFFCIAPTSSGRRCRWDISQEELDEANLCRRNAASMQPGPDRDYELQRHVLARCCGDQHREKLSAAANQARWCVEDVCDRMSEMLASPRLNAPRELRYGRQRTALPASRMLTDYSGRRRNRMLLPARTVVRTTPAPAYTPSTPLSPFVPYLRLPELPINSVFTQNAADEYQAGAGKRYSGGHVYILQWPSHPDFVKIGYTTGSVSGRVFEWTECHPGLKCVYEEYFVFPKRMEKLVHLELHQRRRKIEICPRLSCGSTHHEWFEVPAQQAIDVIQTWANVASKERIYGSYGAITDQWQNRVDGMAEDLTAQVLSDMLDAEEKAAEAAKIVAEIVAPQIAKSVQVLEATGSITAAAVQDDLPSLARQTPPSTYPMASVLTQAIEDVKLPEQKCSEVRVPQEAANAQVPVLVQKEVSGSSTALFSDSPKTIEHGIAKDAIDDILSAFGEFMASLQEIEREYPVIPATASTAIGPTPTPLLAAAA